MYKIYAETNGVKVCIHDDTVESDEVKVLEPRLHLADSNAGSLDFKLAPNNVAFQPIKYTQDLATALVNGTAIDILSDMQSTGTGYDLITNQMHDIPAVPVTQQGITVNQDADSLYFDYSITNDGGDLDLSEFETAESHQQLMGYYLQYPKRNHQDPDDDYIDVSNVSDVLFYGEYTKEDTLLVDRSVTPVVDLMHQGGIDTTKDGTDIDSDYTIRTTGSIIFSQPSNGVSRTFYIDAKLKDGINKQLEWCIVNYVGGGWQPTYNRQWTVFKTEQDRITMSTGTTTIRLLCRYTDRTPIVPGDIVYAKMYDKMELAYRCRIKYSENGEQKEAITTEIKQGEHTNISAYPNRTGMKIIVCRGVGDSTMAIDAASMQSARLEIGPSCTQHVYWFDESGTAIPDPVTPDPDWPVESDNLQNSFPIPDAARKFKIGIHSTMPIAVSNLRFANAYPQTTATVKMEYSVNAIALMETKITVCRDLTTKTDGHRWNWKHYAESEMENGFVDYDGNEIEDDYTLISDMFELGSGARSIRVDVTAAENQNESFPDIKWGIVFYDNSSTPQFVRCDRWFDNHSGYDHLGVLDGLYNYRIMIRYVETEHPVSISFNQFSDIKSQQWWSVTNRKEKEIWEGRVISEDIDFWNNRVIHCEGEMAYLNDTLQPARAYDNYTIPQYVKALIDIHNSKSKSDRQFLVGSIWAPENSKLDRRITQYESTLELLNKLVEDYGGHLYVHKGTVGGKTGRVIDWLEDFPSKLCTQTINFGENLLDFTRNYDMSQMCTVVMPTGEVIQEAQSSKAGDPLSINNGNGPTYGQLLYKADDGRVYIRKGKNLGGYKTGVAVVEPNKTYYFSGRLHGGYVAYTIKSNSDGTGDYYDGGTVTAGSASEVGFVDYIDKEITIPAGAHSVVMCSFGNDIQMALKKQVKEVEGLDVLLTVEKIGDDIETVTENGQQVKKTWHVKGSPYVSNPDTIAKYGWIEKRLDLPDVTTEQDLYDAAKKYLKDGQFEEMTLEVSAIDMNSLGALVDDIMLLDQVRVVSEPHNLDKYFPVTEIDIPLDNPADQTFTLGNKHEVSLTETSSSANEKLKQQIMKAPSASKAIAQANKSAAEAISRGTTDGYINFVTNDDGHPCEFVMSNMLDYKNTSAKVWRWNQQGLYHSNSGYNGTYDTTVGITADGQIWANEVRANHFEGVTIDGGQLTIGANTMPSGVENQILVRDSASDSSYVLFKADHNTGRGRVIFGCYKSGANIPYASIEEYSITQQNQQGQQTGLHKGIRILGNGGDFTGGSADGGLILIQTDDLAVAKWNGDGRIRSTWSGQIDVGGSIQHIEVLNGFIVNAW